MNRIWRRLFYIGTKICCKTNKKKTRRVKQHSTPFPFSTISYQTLSLTYTSMRDSSSFACSIISSICPQSISSSIFFASSLCSSMTDSRYLETCSTLVRYCAVSGTARIFSRIARLASSRFETPLGSTGRPTRPVDVFSIVDERHLTEVAFVVFVTTVVKDEDERRRTLAVATCRNIFFLNVGVVELATEG